MSLTDTLLRDINQAIESDQLTLPTLPEVALRVQEMVNDPDATIKDISDTIGMDAALSARLIRIANSPLMRGISKVDSLLNALNRLGIHFVQNITTGLAMEQIFQATNDIIDKRMRKVWEHSKEVASISRVLAYHYTDLSVDKVTLAGLTHEIGILPILTYAEEHPNLFENETILDEAIQKIHPQLGSRILHMWDFPEDLVEIPQSYQDFSRAHEGPADYIDIISVANLQSYLRTDHVFATQDWDCIPACKKLGFNSNTDLDGCDVFSGDLSMTKQILA